METRCTASRTSPAGLNGRKAAQREARKAFDRAVMDRDGCRCVLCKAPAVDAHHVMDRKLFEDGGYVLTNGVSVCEPCHVLCETTEVSCEDVRRAAGITDVHLPPGFDPKARYDKWGNRHLQGGLRLAGPLIDDDGCARSLVRGGFDHLVVRPDGLPIPDWVGYAARSPEEWGTWRSMVAALHEGSMDGGPLAGWLFHGSTSEKGKAITAEGMRPTKVMIRRDGEQVWVKGSFWGSALMAAWIAEDDLQERNEARPDLTLSIVTASVTTLSEGGVLVADEATLDFPDMMLKTTSETELWRRIEEAGAGIDWRASLEIVGSVALLHGDRLRPEGMMDLDTAGDVGALIEIVDQGQAFSGP